MYKTKLGTQRIGFCNSIFDQINSNIIMQQNFLKGLALSERPNPDPQHQRQRPTFWSSTDKYSSITLSDGNLTARKGGGGFLSLSSGGSVRAADPIPPDGNYYYFEVGVKKGEFVAVGLTPAASSLEHT